MALAYELLPEQQRKIAAERLVKDVNNFKHITTGFLGTPVLNDALTDFGYPELAFTLLFNDRYPSWLYPVKMGATTIWERWDGIKPDGSFQDVGMNSFNHYAYGAIGNWLYTKVAGIQVISPGYKEFLIKPVLNEKLQFAEASYNSMYGVIKSRWELSGKKIKLIVTVPPNTKADIYVPSENSLPETKPDGAEFAGYENGYLIFKAGSGTWQFETIV